MANLLIVVSINIILFSVSVTLSAPKGKQNRRVNFTVTVYKDNPRFQKDIGRNYTLRTMENSTKFVKDTLGTYKENVTEVSLFIEDMGHKVAETTGDEIHVNSRYIEGYNGSVKTEFTGIIFEKMTGVWQLNGQGNAPESVLSGIADYVRLQAGYTTRSWVAPKGGKHWNESSNVTARFFDFCEYVTRGFFKDLNKEMAQKSFDINAFFTYKFQTPLDTMWVYYKHGHVPP